MRPLAFLGAAALLLIGATTTMAATTPKATAPKTTATATANDIWHARISDQKLRGGATVDLLANGRTATAAVKLYGLTAGRRATATVDLGTCSSTGASGMRLATLTISKVPASGIARVWAHVPSRDVATLRTAASAKTTLSVDVADGTLTTCSAFSTGK